MLAAASACRRISNLMILTMKTLIEWFIHKNAELCVAWTNKDTFIDLDSALTSQGWRTEAEIRRMSEGDKRNTIIAELNEVTGLSIGQLGGKSNPELLELIGKY